MNGNEIVIHEKNLPALSASQVREQVNLIHQVMKDVMQEGMHFGTIPGCGSKPTLFKPGAEKLGMTFRLSPRFEISRHDLPNGHREYEVKSILTHIDSGLVIGEGVGCCSTMETKYRYRGGAGRKCPKCGVGSIIKTNGGPNPGGYWCVPNKGGCGANFKPGDPDVEGQQLGKSENPDIADTWNTVLKMAKKRAQVDAILTATAASDIFTQDIEDFIPNDLGARQDAPAPAKADPPAHAVATRAPVKKQEYWSQDEAIQRAGEVGITQKELVAQLKALGRKGYDAKRDTGTVQMIIQAAKAAEGSVGKPDDSGFDQIPTAMDETNTDNIPF